MRIPAIHVHRVVLGVTIMFVSGSCATRQPIHNVGATEAIDSSERMPDGKEWTTSNLNLHLTESYCYEGLEPNCRRYGRLYSWQSARRGCQALGDGWRLPTNDDWFQLAQRFGGIRGEFAEAGRAAYVALSRGGSSGFNALLGGGRAPDGGDYSRLEAHGFYWTASETSSTTAWFYNFGKGQSSLGRHEDGEKGRAFSVRCVRDT